MSFTLPSHTRSGLRRRSLLAGAAGAALLVGCSSEDDSSTAAGPSAAERARARVARDSEVLAERYAAVIAAHPALAATLTPLRAEVVRHAKAFGGADAPSESASPSASGSPSPLPVRVPTDEKSALAELATAERKLADRRAKALLEVPGELARLMASVAAAGAGHAFLLAEGAK
ncbi:hypothetical protein SGFS_038480 [Streptomyces graminofaciens]|uniref:Lipoprotein n=1 Tax=Streptomyces graminofaciens TaxID=68212 RepID=A0ABN5VGR8_9ACTN|nr:hypothetical protein [Streptomyces graminofaciens]BBC32554.1 hypothetical protein SGFS_038480 [Streptomyces graminofaciens]